MKSFLKYLVMVSLAMILTGSCVVKSKKDYPLKPVPFTEVSIDDGFWTPRMETNRRVSIPYAFGKCEETGRIDNFAVAGGLMEGTFCGIYPFDDTDVYKILEGASYSLSIHPDPTLEKYLDDLIVKIAAAQEDDGYLYTARTINPDPPVRWVEKERWSNLRLSHELYNAGHLYEAAAAHYLSTGKRTLLEVALRNADLVESAFGPNRTRDTPGHQVIEIGLVKLYRVTGKEKYLKLAKFFLDERGHPHERELYGEYAQDHQPVIEQSEPVGHAVRATYMYAGMADVAALTGDSDYVKALERIWENVVSKKLYLTGGVGARHGGESFGDDYELPNASAYNETCAAIGNALWNHRLFLLHGDSRYLDVLERVLYNGLISGVSLNGDRFFYTNPLESHGQHERSPWFGCACCPGNVTRFLPSFPGYVYATQDDILYVCLFVAGSAVVKMKNRTVSIEQETLYPWEGDVKITVNPEQPEKFSLYIRIPGWTQNHPIPSDLYHYLNKSEEKVTLKVNDKQVALDQERGFARIKWTWKKGDVIHLHLPMSIRRVLSHDEVEDNRGKVALERGPIVYCAEWADNNGHVSNLILSDEEPLRSEYHKETLNGLAVIQGLAVALKREKDGKSVTEDNQDFLAIPYYAWAHRGKGEMTVWLARTASKARILPNPSVSSTSRVSTSGGTTPTAINDQYEPKHSNDHSIPRFQWWPRKGTKEWVQYDFNTSTRVSAVEVYWFDDTGQGECRVPKSWRLLYQDGNKWKPVIKLGTYGVEKDKFNRVEFRSVKTPALRLEVQLQPDFSAGILEWRVQ